MITIQTLTILSLSLFLLTIIIITFQRINRQKIKSNKKTEHKISIVTGTALNIKPQMTSNREPLYIKPTSKPEKSFMIFSQQESLPLRWERPNL